MRAAHGGSAWRRRTRGQTLVLAMLMMLVVTLTVFFTFTIGVRTRRKVQLQAVADSGAYSLAVAEARAFNFYALSNRALVAHEISILSVHAHQSYFSFYEDLLGATGRNYKLIADELSQRCSRGSRESCDAKDRVLRISRLYLNSDFDPVTSVRKQCDWVNGVKLCRVDRDCAGDGTCDLDYNKLRGAVWFHDQWHSKDASNTCYQLVLGSRDHFEKVLLLRAHQLRVDAQLKVMMTGDLADARWDAGEAAAVYPGSTKKTQYEDPHVSREPLRALSLTQGLARVADKALTAQESAGRVSLRYYKTAVDNGIQYNLHKDYDEILAGTRFPRFLTQRDFRSDPNWERLANASIRASRGKGFPQTTVDHDGTARMIKVGDGQVDPGLDNQNDPLDGVFPPAYPGDPSGMGGALPWGGRQLAQAAHRGGHDQLGFGESDGLLAEDHGVVRSQFRLPSGTVLRARADVRPGRNGVWADPHDFDRTAADEDTTHSFHVFHGDLMAITGHGTSLGDCSGMGCDTGVKRGLYRGHMRFRLANLRAPDDLWNLPRTLSLITRPAREPREDPGTPWPWEFKFKASLPGPVKFSTVDARGDADSGNTMAALAAGLVYFHKPSEPQSNEEYGEPPNLWNPFWRAKLHPVKQADALEATRSGHYRTWLLLNDLSRWSAVNY